MVSAHRQIRVVFARKTRPLAATSIDRSLFVSSLLKALLALHSEGSKATQWKRGPLRDHTKSFAERRCLSNERYLEA